MKIALPMQRLSLLTALAVSAAFCGLPVAVAAPATTANQNAPAAPSGPRETYGDWQVICQAVPADQQQKGAPKQLCEVTQQATDKQSNKPLARVEMVSIEGNVRGNFLVPLGVALTKGASLNIDGASASPATPYATCLPGGCIVPFQFDPKKTGDLNKGKKLNLSITSIQGQALTATFSLNGFQKAIQRSAELTK